MSPLDRKEPQLGLPNVNAKNAAQGDPVHKKEAPNIRALGQERAKDLKDFFNIRVFTPYFLTSPKSARVAAARYKWFRLWWRFCDSLRLQMGGCVLIAALLIGFCYTSPTIRSHWLTAFEKAQTAVYTMPEYQIRRVKINGATADLDQKIRKALDLQLPASSLVLDFAVMVQKIEHMDEIKHAEMFLDDDGTLALDVTPNQAVVLWRKGNLLELLNANGKPAGRVQSRLERRELPVIVGVGVENHIPQALEIFAALGPFYKRTRGLRRVGERRWDIMLNNNQTIKLPDVAPVSALQAFLQKNTQQQILERAVINVDLRDTARMVLQFPSDTQDSTTITHKNDNL